VRQLRRLFAAFWVMRLLPSGSACHGNSPRHPRTPGEPPAQPAPQRLTSPRPLTAAPIGLMRAAPKGSPIADKRTSRRSV
jgi:hypothetical protein